MQIYLDIIRGLIQSSQTVSPGAIWFGLCETFSSKAKMKKYFYPCSLEYLSVTNWFVQMRRFPDNNIFFSSALNSVFMHQKIIADSEFSKLLQAFLTYFPEFREDLIENVRPAVVPAYVISEKDINDTYVALYEKRGFSRAARLFASLVLLLPAAQLNQVTAMLAENLDCYDFGVESSAHESLAVMCALRPDVNLGDYFTRLITQLQDPDYFVRKRAVFIFGDLGRIKEFDLPPIFEFLEKQRFDESVHVRIAAINALAMIYRKRKNGPEVYKILSSFSCDPSCRVNELVNSLQDEINGCGCTSRFLKTTPVNSESTVVSDLKCGEDSNSESKSDATPMENIVRTKVASLHYLAPDIFEETLASLIEIANLHESLSISLILPAFTKVIEMADDTSLEMIISVLEKLSNNLNKYFMLGLLTPRLEEVTDSSARLSLLLVRQKICQRDPINFLLKCEQPLTFIPPLPPAPVMFEHKSF